MSIYTLLPFPLFKTLSCLFCLYRDTRCIPKSRAVHAKLITSGSYPDIYTNNQLLSFYFKFNRLHDAHNVFEKMPERNVISWSVFISGYSQMGMAEEALNWFRLMVYDGFEPNEYTYVGVVSACASVGDVRAEREIHGKIYRSGLELEFNSYVGNCLINMYGKCGLLKSARMVFDASLEPNSISWTSLLSSYIQCGENLEGLKIFSESQRAGTLIIEFSCASVFGACAALEDLKVGMRVHCFVLKCGHEFEKFVMSGLINFYAKCKEIGLANRAFLEVDQPHLSAWIALIGGYVQQEAIDLFLKLHSSGFKPSERIFSSVLGAFPDAMDIEAGKQLHSLIIRMGFSSFTSVGNAVLDFYSKCGLLEESYKFFEEIDERDVVSWNALISGHVRSGQHGEAIKLLKNMLVEGHDPNIYTYSGILSICIDVPVIEWGKQTHCCIIKPGFDSNIVIGSTLINMMKERALKKETGYSWTKLKSKMYSLSAGH